MMYPCRWPAPARLRRDVGDSAPPGGEARSRRALRGAAALIAAAAASVALCGNAAAATVTWIGGNSDWLDGSSQNSNWSPGDEPDSGDNVLFNTSDAVAMGDNNSIAAMTLSGGIDLNTNGFDLTANGLVQLSGAGTNFFIGTSASAVAADSVSIASSARLELNGGTLTVNEETGVGVLTIDAGGTLAGHGTVSLTESVGAGVIVLSNEGIISAERAPAVAGTAPPAGVLAINANDGDARADLDGGGSEDGIVQVMRNQTLDVNVPLADAFDGAISLFHNAALEVSSAWALAGGTIVADNGFFPQPPPDADIPAATSFIRGGTLTQSGGTITVLDADGTLQIESAFAQSGGSIVNNGTLRFAGNVVQSGGTLTNNGTLQFDAGFDENGGTIVNNGMTIFNANATINSAANFAMPADTSSLTVNAGRTVTVNQSNFDIDGNGTATNVITLHAGALLDVNLGAVANVTVGGVVNLHGGALDVSTGIGSEIVMNGTLMLENTGSAVPRWSGAPVDVGNDTAGAASLVVGGSGVSRIDSQLDINADADVTIHPGATLVLGAAGGVDFNSQNGSLNAQIDGAGTLVINGPARFLETTTLNMVGGTIDLDGEASDLAGDVVDVNAPLIIKAATLASFGKANLSGGNILRVDNQVAAGTLAVTLDDPAAEWTINAPGTLDLVNDNAIMTLLTGNPLNVNGTMNVTGRVRVMSRLDIDGTVNLLTAAQSVFLGGGDIISAPNTITGGTINGPATLAALTGKALIGFGSINTPIIFDGTSELRADNGTLTVQDVLDVGVIGTADGDGVLNVLSPWSANGAAIELIGGSIQGGAITNNGIIRGNGTIASTTTITSSGQVRALTGNTLSFTGTNGTCQGSLLLLGGTLQFSQPLAIGATGTLSGDGTASVAGTLENFGLLNLSSGSITTNQLINHGALEWNGGDVQLDSLQITTGGVMTMAAGGDKVLTVPGALNINTTDGSRLNLIDNKLVTSNPVGSFAGSSYNGVSGLVDAGRGNAGDALWDGSGIVTSDPRAIDNGDLVSIGVAKAGDVRGIADSATMTFGGETVLGSDTLVMVTWGGDANLDGKINIDDYGRIDGNVAQSGSAFGWFSGDFNYDGKINIDDYGIIDGNINRQGAPFMTGGGVGVAAVPEPAGTLLIGISAGLMPGRRRWASRGRLHITRGGCAG